ncbi:hypothetical protein [Actinoallomurus sp. CA-142502]|uniref:hypothetical protein n=1 Tax=Actinoallomurus sp. CA-142502 TaxID=3239885 RepID=UPI003D94E259
MLGGEVAAAGALVVIVVVPGLLATAVSHAADAAADATQAARAVGVVRAVNAADLGVAATVVVALIVVIVTLGKRHLVHPVVEHTLVVRPETRLVVHCPEHVGR